jgi:signal peptidase
MEIETAPRPPAPTPWGRLLLFVVILAPVSVLVLLPIGLGLERYVMTGDSMEGSVDRGAIAFERVVPVSDLRVGDLVTYRRPDAANLAEDGTTMVTRRIVSIGPEGIRTQGDAMVTTASSSARADASTMSRVEFTVPWIGWAYLSLFHPQAWVLTVASAAVLVALTTRRLRRPEAVAPAVDLADLATAKR